MNIIAKLTAVTGCLLSLGLAAQVRPKVAVLSFEDISGNETPAMKSINAGRKISENFLVQFVNSGKFDVVEREQIEKTLREQNFSASGNVDPAQVAAFGKLTGVDYIITGTIETDFQQTSSGSNIIVNIRKTTLTMHVKISAKLVNVTTGSVVSAETAEGNAESKSTATDFSSGEQQKSLAGLFDQAAAGASKKILDKFIPRAIELFKPVAPKVLVAAVDGSTVYLNAGANAGLVNGAAVKVMREGEPILDPVTQKVIKIRKTFLCEATLSSVEDASAEATLAANCPPIQAKDVIDFAPPAPGGAAPAAAAPTAK